MARVGANNKRLFGLLHIRRFGHFFRISFFPRRKWREKNEMKIIYITFSHRNEMGISKTSPELCSTNRVADLHTVKWNYNLVFAFRLRNKFVDTKCERKNPEYLMWCSNDCPPHHTPPHTSIETRFAHIQCHSETYSFPILFNNFFIVKLVASFRSDFIVFTVHMLCCARSTGSL